MSKDMLNTRQFLLIRLQSSCDGVEHVRNQAFQLQKAQEGTTRGSMLVERTKANNAPMDSR